MDTDMAIYRSEILHSEILEIPGCPGYAILLAGNPKENAFARELARVAQICSGHPWVSAEQVDEPLLAAIKSHWATAKPGWLRDSSNETIANLLGHSCISHHLPSGCVLLSGARLDAVRLLVGRPELAARRVLGYLGYGGIAIESNVLDLVLVEGSATMRTKLVLDHDAYDEDIECYDSVCVRGESFAAKLLREVQS